MVFGNRDFVRKHLVATKRSMSAILKANQICAFYFFSSRRLHTRSTRDWSSDVCSSDLRQRVSNEGSVTWRNAHFCRTLPVVESQVSKRFQMVRLKASTQENRGQMTEVTGQRRLQFSRK